MMLFYACQTVRQKPLLRDIHEEYSKIALVLTKILELLHWVGTASMAALAICSVAAGPWLSGLLERILPQYRPELNTYGYEMTVTNAAGAVEPRAVLLFGISAVFILSLMAMVFRNVHLILKNRRKARRSSRITSVCCGRSVFFALSCR